MDIVAKIDRTGDRAMTREDFDAHCAGLPATSHVVQWGGSSVWKVGGKIFAIWSNWSKDDRDRVGFKCSDLAYSILIEQDGIVPSKYLARAKWVQVLPEGVMSDEDLKAYIEAAHGIIAGKLTRKARKDLGLAN